MEILSLQFVQFALLSAFLVSICSGIVGSIIVSNKTVFLSGGVAHSAFGGVGLALYFGFNVMLGAAITSILMSLLLLYFIIHKKKNIDSFIAAAWAFGMALGVILIDITPGYGIDLTSYLIVDAVGNDVTIMVDGGIRTGSDIFKALAIGADSVLIGRPYVPMVYGGGKEGIKVYTDKLGAELIDTMTMCGAHSLDEISRDMIYFAKESFLQKRTQTLSAFFSAFFFLFLYFTIPVASSKSSLASSGFVLKILSI